MKYCTLQPLAKNSAQMVSYLSDRNVTPKAQWIKHVEKFPFLHSMEKKSTKVDFSPISCKKHHSTLEMDTFKGMLLLSYLALLDNKPRTCL